MKDKIVKDINEFKLTNKKFSGKRILLVEDNELSREIAVEIIGTTGVLIDTAINGLEAVEMITKSQEGFYQLVLMDIQMPVMDGYQATQKIRTLIRTDVIKMPIIAMTAYTLMEDKIKAISSGMNAFLIKPIEINAIINIMMKYL